ncbi:type II toxin-antitoxin system YafQ family toxin [Cryomorpha ignava]|uniref:Type II toxin-antitoxin system YafQ family toxin n=1 Tax=Cryomorpha ignava TaxID=101383 RepID=A0A7K3WVN9_9FLAO|nr:type II toxin-antitoxin system YafQ family toxin [Cryomorpha ignava]NEN25747.1 type II toxin-antitoxin system YafQ family toxin [Cryomorpha ignava]
MYEIFQTNQFKKDLKTIRKRGLKMELLDLVVTSLVEDGKIYPTYKPHKLKGNYKGYWECHIEPDWLLIWKKDDNLKCIFLTRTGTHSDLFN